MPNGSILQQIANPVTADPIRSFAGGRQVAGQQNLLRQQARGAELTNIAAEGAIESSQLKSERSEAAYDILAAFSIGPGGSRDRILGNILNKSKDPQVIEIAQDILNTPEGKERERKLLNVINFSQQSGYLPKPTAAAKTAGQIERGVVVEETKAEAALLKAQQEKGDKPTKITQLINERNTMRQSDPNNPDLVRLEAAIDKESTRTGQRITVSPDGTMTVETGISGGLTKPTTTAVQKSIIGLEQQLGDLEVIGGDFQKAYLSRFGQAKEFVLDEIDKLVGGLEEGPNKDFLQGSRKFKEGVEQVFNAYRKEITGAQAAMAEIKMLRDSVVNKKLGPSEFEASFNRYTRQVKRHLALKKKFLNRGLSGVELGDAIDRAVITEDYGGLETETDTTQPITATGPNNEKLILRNGQWEKM